VNTYSYEKSPHLLTVSAGSARQNSDSTSSYDPKILKAAKHQVNNHIYTLKNIGRDLEPKETLVDVAYKSIQEEWEKKKNDFKTIKFAIKYETLKARAKAKGKMPENIGNQRDVDKFKDIRSEQRPILLVDGHGKRDHLSDSQIPIDPIETDDLAIPTAKKSRAGGRMAKRGAVPSAKKRSVVQAFLVFEQRTNDERHKYRVAATRELEGWIGPDEAKALKERIADLEQNLTGQKQSHQKLTTKDIPCHSSNLVLRG
jgi:hypothetical protein